MLPWVFACVAAGLLPMALGLSGSPTIHAKLTNKALLFFSRHDGIKQRSDYASARENASVQPSLLRKARYVPNGPWQEAKRKAEQPYNPYWKAYWWLNLRSSQEYLLNNATWRSQNNEDGIIEYLFKNLNTTNKYYVEFGAEDGTQDNTRRLREQFGWSGLTMDNKFENRTIGLFKETVTPRNIAAIFRKHGVPKEMDLLSVDVDSFDAFVLRSILNASYRPRVIIVETNDNFGEDSLLSFPGDVKVRSIELSRMPAPLQVRRLTQYRRHQISHAELRKLTRRAKADCGQICSFQDPRDKGIMKTTMCGASVRALDYIAGKAGYQSVYLNKVNLFLVRQDLLPSRMRNTWDLHRVLRQSPHLGREKKAFPRKGCEDLISGLVDVRDF